MRFRSFLFSSYFQEFILVISLFLIVLTLEFSTPPNYVYG